MTMKDIMELSIPQLEYILEGCNKNTEEVNKKVNNTNSLEGSDAIQFLMKQGEIK